MKSVRLRKAVCLSAVAWLALSGAALSETVTTDWADINYTLCEGFGIHGSGRVKVRAETDASVVKSLTVTTTHAKSHTQATRITYKDAQGNQQTVRLQKAWFDTIGAEGNQTLYLPRVMTSSRGAGPHEQMQLIVQPGSSIDFTVSVLFSEGGGACSGSSTGTLSLN